MRVMKPQNLGFLSRPFEFAGKLYCGFSILAFIPLGHERRLLSEVAMWKMVSEVLGDEGILDAGIPKKRGEFLVAGSAWPISNTDSTMCRARVQFGQLDKTLNVIGDRYFRGQQPSEPKSFKSIPLRWEFAFGGEGYSHNPLGTGFKPVVDQAGQKVHSLPNIEYPNEMIGLPGQRPRPAGFGPVDGMWAQRTKKVGTYDQDWLKNDYPGFARDIDWTYFNVASEDQQSGEVFRGDESFLLEGLHPELPKIEGVLPGFKARCFIVRSGSDELEELSCNLTTVWFFPDREHAVTIFHACAAVERPDAQDLAQVMIAAEDFASDRPLEHYGQVLIRWLDEDKGTFERLRDDDLLPEGLEKDGASDPDSMIREWAEGIRARNLRGHMEDKLDTGQAQLDSTMSKLGAELPPDPKLPDFEIDPARLNEISLAEMPRLIDRLESYAKEAKTEMQVKAIESEEVFEQSMNSLQEKFPDSNAQGDHAGQGPPTFKATQKEAEIVKQINVLKSTGADVSEMEEAFLGDDMKSFLVSSEQGLNHGYRMAAHYQQPAVPKSSPRDMRDRLLQRIETNGSLDAQDFTGANLADVDLSGADLSGIFLESADLSRANLQGARLENAVLSHANLSGAKLDGANLKKANLGKSSMCEVSAIGADFSGAILAEADVSNAVFDDAILSEADLRGARISGCSFGGSRFEEYFLMDEELESVNFAGAKLDRSVFFNVQFANVNFSGSSLHEAAFVRCAGQGLNFSKANLKNLRIVLGTDFSKCAFSSADMTESCLRDAIVDEADFSHANLSKADLSGATAARSNFHGAILTGCQFVQSDLSSADLAGANLMGGSLERADLRGASLKGANLFQADLARVHVDKQTKFESALMKQVRTYPRKFPSGA